MHKFFKSLLEIIKLYTILLLVLGFCYWLIKDIELWILNIGFMVVLVIGVFVDSRFNWKSKVIIIVISIIQLLLYYYLELIPILLVKDLFWYSVVLNTSFIWHVLILHWLFEVSVYYKWDYGYFMFSRMSVITSLTGIYWLLMFLLRVVVEIGSYYCWTKREIGWFKKILKFIFVDSKIIESFLYIISYIVLYFIKNFTDYCLVLLGKSKFGEIFKSMDRFFSFYWLFMFTLSISILLMWPRIYIIWIWFVCQKTYEVIEMLISYWNKGIYQWDMIFHLTFNQSFRSPFYFRSEYSEELLKIYNKEFYLEYKVYLNLDHFFPNDYGYSSNLFDICEIFIYSQMRRYRIILLYLFTIYGDSGGIDDSELEKYEKEYNLVPIESDDCVPFTREPNFPSKDFDWENGSLWRYLILEDGIYMP